MSSAQRVASSPWMLLLPLLIACTADDFASVTPGAGAGGNGAAGVAGAGGPGQSGTSGQSGQAGSQNGGAGQGGVGGQAGEATAGNGGAGAAGESGAAGEGGAAGGAGSAGDGGAGGGCQGPGDCAVKPCQSVACEEGLCSYTAQPDGTSVDDDLMGDCRKRLCEGGKIVYQPDESDTMNGECGALGQECTQASDCPTKGPCSRALCDKGICNYLPLSAEEKPDDDVKGDCVRPTCQDDLTYVADPGDTGEDGVCPAVNLIGCADGKREGFVDPVAFPALAACDGAWSIPGLDGERHGCHRSGGDDGALSAGNGCSAFDLCAAGWHLCRDQNDVQAHLPPAQSCATGDLVSGSFYVTAQASSGFDGCSGLGNNGLWGCGAPAVALEASCLPLNARLGEGCQQLGGPATPVAGWSCPVAHQERASVTKAPAGGGVLCCRDEPLSTGASSSP